MILIVQSNGIGGTDGDAEVRLFGAEEKVLMLAELESRIPSAHLSHSVGTSSKEIENNIVTRTIGLEARQRPMGALAHAQLAAIVDNIQQLGVSVRRIFLSRQIERAGNNGQLRRGIENVDKTMNCRSFIAVR
jgi:hypothetical protein